jgi:hypothetical protein
VAFFPLKNNEIISYLPVPVILASWEAEIGGSQLETCPGKEFQDPISLFQASLGKTVYKTHLIGKMLAMVTLTCHPKEREA